MANLINVGVIDADADFTLTDGQSVRIALMPPVGGTLANGCHAVLRYKTGSDYTDYATLASGTLEDRALRVDSPGVWNVKKFAGPNFGIDKS